jgi:hypothetical protein
MDPDKVKQMRANSDMSKYHTERSVYTDACHNTQQTHNNAVVEQGMLKDLSQATMIPSYCTRTSVSITTSGCHE